MKCKNCIHETVCKYKPHKSDPPDVFRVVDKLCEDYIDENKLLAGDNICKCPVCRTEWRADMKYCRRCGAAMN